MMREDLSVDEMMGVKAESDRRQNEALRALLLHHHPQGAQLVRDLTDIAARLTRLAAFCLRRRDLHMMNLCMHYLVNLAQSKFEQLPVPQGEKTGTYARVHLRILDALANAIQDGKAFNLAKGDVTKVMGCSYDTFFKHFSSYANAYVAAYEHMIARKK
ncbi:MAG TPA: hypothetical protein VFO38_00820 [Candidatus Saccharimonadales bacterium]|nr:hypothetical protein [Candidatus Saccharimonadales bacterium]